MFNGLTRPIAMRIINSLKDGVPSVEDIQYFSSSRNTLYPLIESDLKEISNGNYGKVKFLNGSYGEGKTHFLSRIRNEALNDGFLVSMFAISPRGIALDMMERTFSELIKTLMINGYTAVSEETVIEYILSRWISNVEDFEPKLRNLHLDKDLMAALLQIAKCIPQRKLRYQHLDILNGWLRGETHPIGELKKQYQICNHIKPRNVFDILKSLGKFFKSIGYKGWIILIDEQEIVSTLLTTRRRELTNQNIRYLIDEQGNLDGIYVLFATTDEFFTDPNRGVVSYPALKTRITQANTLSLPSIGKAEMEELSENLKTICEMAWGLQMRITSVQLKNCAGIALERNIPSARARTYVKSIIRLMESIRDGQGKDPVATFAEIYNTTFAEVATEKEEAQSEVRNNTNG